MERHAYLLFALALTTFASGCGHAAAPVDASSTAADEAGYTGSFTQDPSLADAGAPSAPSWDASPPSIDDIGIDATTPTVSSQDNDATPDGACNVPLAAGDLAIDELMIASVAGTGDYGEWLEVVSTRACTLNLLGLHGECAKGSKVITFDVTSDEWIAPQGMFVVANSGDPVIDHALPGLIFVWSAGPSDVLRNEGATVTLTMSEAIVDSITYPALKLVIGTSIAFPLDCPSADRSNWTLWQPSTSSWFPGFFGTPNAPNLDVHCPPSP